MWCARLLMFFLIAGGLWRHVRCTCVLESEFGFTLNCAFKKSGLFRVRNLGGIKAHVGLGFTVGDELGFPESLSNVEFNRRRSSQTNGFQNVVIAESMKNVQNNQLNKINVRQPPTTTRPQIQVKPQLPQPVPLPMAMMPPKSPNKMPMDIEFTVPPFKPIPPAAERATTNKIPAMMEKAPVPAMAGVIVPAFHAIPTSISRISTSNAVAADKATAASIQSTQVIEKNKSKLSSSNLALRTLSTGAKVNSLPQISLNTIETLAANSNISVEAIQAAIAQKQQQLMKQQKQQQISVTTTRRPVTSAPKKTTSNSKVMNAPKEYYPVGYDKNFDDNFSSRVELPDTSFYCGDQKHFPGLYADEDLGCMVFHVCALTDDGLIMKSFLCPESTLFDQTILKCNWWFYVDCKNSKKLYDSNIPISKSYQLMKALTFFSSYKKDQQTPESNTEIKN